MNDSQANRNKDAIEHAIAHAEAALALCDEHGFVFAAIDISSAIDKLNSIRAKATVS